MRLLLAGWRQILQHLQATQMADGGYVCFSVPAPGHGGPHRHGQRYTKIEDHLAPIVKPLRDSAIKRAEHDPQQLRQPCTFAAKCRAVIPTQAAASVRGSGRPAARFAPVTRKSDAPHAMRSRRGKSHSRCKGRFRRFSCSIHSLIQKMRKLRCKKEAAPGLGSECGGFEMTLAPLRPVQQLGRSVRKMGRIVNPKCRKIPTAPGGAAGKGGV